MCNCFFFLTSAAAIKGLAFFNFFCPGGDRCNRGVQMEDGERKGQNHHRRLRHHRRRRLRRRRRNCRRHQERRQRM